MDQKPVSFKLKSRGVKRPLVARENVPPAEHPAKRHLVARFVNLMKAGTIQLATTSDVKDLIGTGAVKKIRPLGSPSSQLVGESPSRSLMVELNASQNDISELGRTVASLQRQMESMQAERLKDKEAIQALQHHMLMQDSFNSIAFEISVRAFTDKLLEAFYIAGGKGSADSTGQARWLQSRDAVEFCQEPRERKMEIFGMTLKPNPNMLKMMKKLRDISSNISKGCAHVTTPITVAYALEGLSDLKDGGVVRQFFKMCFKMDTKEMINQKVIGKLSPEHLRKFRLG